MKIIFFLFIILLLPGSGNCKYCEYPNLRKFDSNLCLYLTKDSMELNLVSDLFRKSDNKVLNKFIDSVHFSKPDSFDLIDSISKRFLVALSQKRARREILMAIPVLTTDGDICYFLFSVNRKFFCKYLAGIENFRKKVEYSNLHNDINKTFIRKRYSKSQTRMVGLLVTFNGKTDFIPANKR